MSYQSNSDWRTKLSAVYSFESSLGYAKQSQSDIGIAMLSTDSPRTSSRFRLVIVAFICAIACLSLLAAFLFGPPLGHSLAANLVWLTSFDAGIWRGEAYPRWLPELWFGAGAPDFFFYGPLPFWVTSIFGRGICWTCDVASLLNAGTLIIIALSGLGYFLFASRFLNFNNSLIAAGIYMILPYHLIIDWGVRQALGELGAISVFPFIGYFLIGLSRGKQWSGVGLAASVAALILCHLPSVVICATVLGPMALYYGFLKKESFAEMVGFLGCAAFWALVGLCIAAFYWMPAFSLLGTVSSQSLWQNTFNWSHWLFFDGQPEPNETLTDLLKVWLIVVSFFVGLALLRLRKNAELAVLITLPLCIAWIFMTPLSRLLWQYLPFLQAIQFPWRFMTMAEFGLPLAIASLMPLGRRQFLAAGVAVAMFSLLSGFGGHQLGNLLGMPRQIVDSSVADHLSAWEYIPKTAIDPILKLTNDRHAASRVDWTSNPGEVAQSVVVSGEAQTGARLINSRRWVVDVTAVTPAQIVFKQFYWDLWSAHDMTTWAEIRISPETKFGLMSFDVPRGESHIAIVLDLHWSEKFGIALSLLGLAIVLGEFWRRRAVQSRAASV
jgi:hypothetical protein